VRLVVVVVIFEEPVGQFTVGVVEGDVRQLDELLPWFKVLVLRIVTTSPAVGVCVFDTMGDEVGATVQFEQPVAENANNVVELDAAALPAALVGLVEDDAAAVNVVGALDSTEPIADPVSELADALEALVEDG